MQVTPLAIPEVLLVEPKVFGDARGFFMETFSGQRYRDAGITTLRVDPLGDDGRSRLDTLGRTLDLVRQECGAA